MSPLIVHTVLQAIDRMLSSGAKSVIITSTELESTKDKLVLLAKNRNGKFLWKPIYSWSQLPYITAPVCSYSGPIVSYTQVSLYSNLLASWKTWKLGGCAHFYFSYLYIHCSWTRCYTFLYCPGEIARVEMPKIPAQFTGAGDLFTALLLVWSDQEELQVC